MGANAYNLYVNLQATTAGLTGGLRSGATQLRQFDGQLQQVNRSLNETGTATQRLARLQASASADAVVGQARVAAAVERTRAAQATAATVAERSGRAQARAAELAARAETERAAAVTAGERALRAQTVAQNMAARAQAATGQGAILAQNTAAAAARAATQAARAQTLQEERAVAAQAAAARAANLSTRAADARQAADARALAAVRAQSEAEAAASARAAANAAAVRRAQAAAVAETRAAAQARIDGFLRTGFILSAILGAGVAESIQLEKRMANVMTISREINSTTISGFTDQIVNLSKDLTQSTDQLADGLYQVVSTGFDGQDAMQILAVAAKGASAGLTTTETSARALLGVLKAYGLTAGDASDVMDIMFQTVNKGVISFEELAQQLGDVVPMAAAAGVNFDDLSSALAAITLAGVPAAESATALNMMLTRLMQPTRELSRAVRSLGYDSAASAVQQDGLYVVVNKLVKATGGQAEAITGLFHDVRASRAVLALAANDGKNYADTYQGIAQQVERAGATQKAFSLQMETTSGQWQLFINRSRAAGIDLGRALLPVMESLSQALSVFAGAVADAPGPLKDTAAALLAVTAGGALTLALVTKLTTQWQAFRAAQAAAQAGGSVMPAVLKGAGLAVSGLTALLAVGVLAYAAYSAAKEKAKVATDDLVTALRAEREQGDEGAGLRALAESLTKSDDAAKLKKVGIDMADAVDAITSGGQKLANLKSEIWANASFANVDASGQVADTLTVDGEKAMKVLDNQHKIWSNAVKKESELAAAMDIVSAKVQQSKVRAAKAWTLDLLVPTGKDGMPQYTDEMKAMAKAMGDIVDPAKAWADAQDKVAKSNKNAKATLKDYMDQLESQLKSQRNFQKNLTSLAVAGYGGLTDHFAKLGVSSAPLLDELVTQLSKGKTKVADELQAIIDESTARSQETFEAGLQQLPVIAARYGKKIAEEFGDASETNDAGKFAKVLQKMAVTDMTRAVKAGSASAKDELQRGMGLLARVTQEKGQDAATALRQALLSGDVTGAMAQLQAIWGADLPISAQDLQGVVTAFKGAGAQSLSEWTGMLQLIQDVSKAKGTEAAQSLTSALLSGDMAAVQAQVDAIGVSVQNIPGSKAISVTVNPPAPVTVTVVPRVAPGSGLPWANKPQPQANGGVLSFYANGGVRRENHVAQIVPAGSWRVWGEDETGGEAYLPLGLNKRARSKMILNEVAHRFGATVTYHADGGLSGWTYEPTGGSDGLFSLSSIASDSMNKKGPALDLSKFAKNLHNSVWEAQRWRKDLGTVARRAGQDVADALEAMGADGIDLTHKMATGSSKYVKAMAKDLERLAAAAKASLSEYTSQLGAAAKDTSAFQQNLAKLAASGYGDLAARLADQGDQAAQDLAAQAVKSKSAASKANKAAKAASATLSDDDLTDLLAIIAAVKTSKTGIHQVADTTELGEDRIIEVANAGLSQLKKALGSRAGKFVTDLGRANKGLSYAAGGVLTPGLYATSNGLIRFAEPATGGEAYIPLGQTKRSSATQVLEDVAHRFGYTLTAQGVTGLTRVDAHPSGGVQVVVVKQTDRPLIGHMPVTVTGGGDGRKTAQAMGAEVMRRLRAAQRGGRL
ncbi:TP901 family phage tail tape measure protein [Streptomyces sp. 3212.3]|uniref:phage tail tape measure protein n=1 Tax=Streptomyces sp. 3212.3 TaxID=1938846 RepID=UPI000E26A1CD|nr:phage tail tape measure protein [Streptomyces sp. 3212.3]REE61447.1 TP901 family phage tail tape measure protein [Streptomyces sp. 3212.3]